MNADIPVYFAVSRFFDRHVKTPALFFAVIVSILLQDPAPRMWWDADTYLAGSISLVSGGEIITAGSLELRGVFSTIIYSPAAALSSFLGGSFGDSDIYTFVLLQNSILIATIVVFLLPSMMRSWCNVNMLSRVLVSISGYFALRGFAPYSLLDIWAFALVGFAICLLSRPVTSHLLLSGIAFGVCLNIRPSYMLPIMLISGACLVLLKLRGGIVPIGIFLAQVPQIVLNKFVFNKFSLVPVDLFATSNFDYTISSYMVRLDSLPYGSQFGAHSVAYCDSEMTKIALRDLPRSLSDLLHLFLSHPQTAISFVLKKIATSIYWPVDAPYFETAPRLNFVFGTLILVSTVFGISRLLVLSSHLRPISLPNVAMILMIVGILVGLVINHVEVRYALPLVLFGFVGLFGLLGRLPEGVLFLGDIHLRTKILLVMTGSLLLLAAHQGLRDVDSCPTGKSFDLALLQP
jgi:hypothetical protein